MLRISEFILAIAICLAGATAAMAQAEQTTTASDRQSVNITVYNSNLGLVRETRRLTVPDGRIALRFADVTAQIRPETVHLGSLTSPAALRILEQNYQYDLLNPAKLLDKFVGKEITLVLRHYQNNTESFEPVQATPLSNNGGQVWRINGQIVINPTNISEIRFPDLPKNLVATPTLVWDVENTSTATRPIASASSARPTSCSTCGITARTRRPSASTAGSWSGETARPWSSCRRAWFTATATSEWRRGSS